MKSIILKELNSDKEYKVVFYSDVTNLPIKRYQLIQKYSLIDAGIGSTISDVLRHYTKLDKFIEVKDYDALFVERENLHMNLLNILSEENTTLYLFASLVESIDGETVTVNDDTIDELVDLIERCDLSYGVLKDVVDFKKKVLTIN
jgi:hypothetical protein